MARIKLAPNVARAIARHGHKIDRFARRRYGISGYQLLARTTAGENAGRMGGSPSSAGARGAGQFIPSTRQDFIRRYRIDPWKNADSAIRGAIIHLQGDKQGNYGGGLEGYNPGGGQAYVDYILGQRTSGVREALRSVGGRRAAGGGGARGASVSGTGPSVSRETVEPGGQGLAPLIAQLQEQEKQARTPQSVGIAPPAFSAQATLPKSFRSLETAGAPTPEGPQLSELLQQVQGLQNEGVGRSTVTPGEVRTSGGGGGGRVTVAGSGGRRLHYGPSGGVAGRLQGSPIDRPGVRTRDSTLEGALAVSAIAGVPIDVGTGTQHSQMTVSGNQSAHWTGGALDLPAAGRRLVVLGRSALIAAGMDPKEARRAKGGLYNVNGWQIIFATGEGGDHTDHLHVQVPRGYRAPGWAHGQRRRRRRR